MFDTFLLFVNYGIFQQKHERHSVCGMLDSGVLVGSMEYPVPMKTDTSFSVLLIHYASVSFNCNYHPHSHYLV